MFLLRASLSETSGNSAEHDYSMMIIQQSSDEQLTTSHKEIHQLGKNCVMLQGKIAFICFSLHASVNTYFCEGPTVEIWLSAQSIMLS